MNTTPLWMPLVVAAIGIGGVWLTQRRADKREDKAWGREQKREQARWAREDSARTFEARRDAYLKFYYTESDYGWGISLYMVGQLARQADDEDSAQLPTGGDVLVKLQDVRIFGSPRVTASAEKVFSAGEDCLEPAKNADWEKCTESIKVWHGALMILVDAIRRDLGVPDERPPRTC